MIKRLLLILICMSACLSVHAQVITNYPPQQTGEQVLNLPQDQNRLYLTLYGDPDDEHYQHIVDWFNSNKTLQSIKQQTHYTAIETTSKLYKERYAKELTTLQCKLPCIRFVTPGGVELLRIDGNKIPMSDSALGKGVKSELMKKMLGFDEPQNNRSPNKLKNAIDDKIDKDLPPVAAEVVEEGLDIFTKIVIAFAVAVAVLFGAGLAIIGAIRKTL